MPLNLLHIILDGIHPPPGRPGLHMPGFAGALDDTQILALSRYMREHFSDRGPWEDLEDRLNEVLDQRDSAQADAAEMAAAEGDAE